jgi:hypothetical protein
MLEIFKDSKLENSSEPVTIKAGFRMVKTQG